MAITKIRNRNRPVRTHDIARLESAIEWLKGARRQAHDAGAYHAADYIARALKSTSGALNHARRFVGACDAKFHAPYQGCHCGSRICPCDRCAGLSTLKGAPESEEEIPPCAASMGCLCAGHARGNPADAACDTTE